MMLQGYIVLVVLIYAAATIQARPNQLQEQHREFQYHQRSSRVSNSGSGNVGGYLNEHHQAAFGDATAAAQASWSQSQREQLRRMAEKMRSEYNTIVASGNYETPAAASTGKTYSTSMAMASSTAGGEDCDQPQAFSFSFTGKTKEQLDEIAKSLTHQIIADLNSGKLEYSQITQPNWFEQRATQNLREQGVTGFTVTPQTQRTVYHQSSHSRQSQQSGQTSQPRVTTSTHYNHDEIESQQRQQKVFEGADVAHTQHEVVSGQSQLEREQQNTQYTSTYPSRHGATVNVRTNDEEYYINHPQTQQTIVTHSAGNVENQENAYDIQSNIPIFDNSYFNKNRRNQNVDRQYHFQYNPVTYTQTTTYQQGTESDQRRQQPEAQVTVPAQTYYTSTTVENSRNTPATQYTTSTGSRESSRSTSVRTSQNERQQTVQTGSRPTTLVSYALFEKYNEPDLKVSHLYRPTSQSTQTEAQERRTTNQENYRATYNPQIEIYNQQSSQRETSETGTQGSANVDTTRQVQQSVTVGTERQQGGSSYQATRNSTESQTNVINRNEQRVTHRYPVRGSTTSTTSSTHEQERTETRRDRPQQSHVTTTTYTEQQEIEAENERRNRLTEEERRQMIEIEKIKALMAQHRENQTIVFPGDVHHTIVTQREHSFTTDDQDLDIGHRTELHKAMDYDISSAEKTQTNERKNLFQTILNTNMAQSEIDRRNTESQSNVMSMVNRNRAGKASTSSTTAQENSQTQSNVMSLVGRNRPKIDLSDLNSNIEERLRYLAETEREIIEEPRLKPNRTIISRDRGDQPPSTFEEDYVSEEILEQEPGIGFYPVDKKPEVEIFPAATDRPYLPPSPTSAVHYTASLAPYDTEEQRRRYEGNHQQSQYVEIIHPAPVVQNQRKEFRREFHRTTTTVMQNGQLPITTHTDYLDVDKGLDNGLTRSSSSSGTDQQERHVQRIEKRKVHSTPEPSINSQQTILQNYQNQQNLEQQNLDTASDVGQQQAIEVLGGQQTMNIAQELLDLNSEYNRNQQSSANYGQEFLDLNREYNVYQTTEKQYANIAFHQTHQMSSRYHQSSGDDLNTRPVTDLGAEIRDLNGDFGQQTQQQQSNVNGQETLDLNNEFQQTQYGQEILDMNSEFRQSQHNQETQSFFSGQQQQGQIDSFGQTQHGQATLDLNSEFRQTQQQNTGSVQEVLALNTLFGRQPSSDYNQQTLNSNTEYGQQNLDINAEYGQQQISDFGQQTHDIQLGFNEQLNYNSPYRSSQISAQSTLAAHRELSTTESEIEALVQEVTSEAIPTSTAKASLWQRFKTKAKDIVG